MVLWQFQFCGKTEITPGQLDKKTLDKKQRSRSGSIEVKKTSRNETLACRGEQAKNQNFEKIEKVHKTGRRGSKFAFDRLPGTRFSKLSSW